MTASHEVDEAHDEAPARASVLLYSDDRSTRDEIRTLVGRRASMDTALIDWTETATADAVLELVRRRPFDLLVLDAEAAKLGGIGLARTLKSEIYSCPPILVLIARPQDAWLASWSEADAVVSAPLDPVELQETVAAQLRTAG